MMTPANTKPILEWHVSLSGICSVAKVFVFKIKFVFLSPEFWRHIHSWFTLCQRARGQFITNVCRLIQLPPKFHWETLKKVTHYVFLLKSCFQSYIAVLCPSGYTIFKFSIGSKHECCRSMLHNLLQIQGFVWRKRLFPKTKDIKEIWMKRN